MYNVIDFPFFIKHSIAILEKKYTNGLKNNNKKPKQPHHFKKGVFFTVFTYKIVNVVHSQSLLEWFELAIKLQRNKSEFKILIVFLPCVNSKIFFNMKDILVVL